jgi:dihydroorotase
VLLPILVREFEKENALDKLPNFIAGYGADFYSIPRTTKEIQLVKKTWCVPNAVHGVVPLAAGETLEWSVV